MQIYVRGSEEGVPHRQNLVPNSILLSSRGGLYLNKAAVAQVMREIPALSCITNVPPKCQGISVPVRRSS